MTSEKIFNIAYVKFLLCLLAAGLFFSAVDCPAAEGLRLTPTVKAVSAALPSVVNISTEKKNTSDVSAKQAIYSEQGQDLEKLIKENEASLGSGCIIDPGGLIITNAHVISGASKIWVTLNDGKRFSAEEIARDDINDLALLRITNLSKGLILQPLKTAKPGDLMLGETVIIIGNTYGLGSSVSMGILSAIGRKVLYKGQIIFSDIIQTDAAVYPGCSGGPMINLAGDMIGINTAIHKEARGIGFAIPLLRIENVLAKWLIPENFNNAFLGMIASCRQLKDGKLEIYVSEVVKDSPAWKAGVRGGELILQADGRDLNDLLDLSRILFQLKRGQTFNFLSEDAKIFNIKLEDYKFNAERTLVQVKLRSGESELNKSLEIFP